MSKAKLKSYSIDEKIKILKCLDQPGMDRKSVREKYGLSESSLRGFIKPLTQMGLDFEPTESWIRRMKKRNNISYKKAHGEKLSADAPAAKHFIDNDLPKLLERYHPDDIFNCDETGLYWRGISDRGYHVNNNNNKNHPSGWKVPKETYHNAYQSINFKF